MAVDPKALLEAKLGPLPVGVWAAGLAGGVYVIHRFTASRSAAATVPPDAGAGAGADTVSTGDAPDADSFTATGQGVTSGPNQAFNVASPPSRPADNDQWYQQAYAVCVAANMDPALVANDLQRYLTGADNFNAQDSAVVRYALAHTGAPPIPPPISQFTSAPPPVVKPPAPKPTPTPTPAPAPTPKPPPAPIPTTISHTIRPGETLYDLLHATWGRFPSVADIDRVAAMNHLTVHNRGTVHETVSPWFAGQVVQLPRS